MRDWLRQLRLRVAFRTSAPTVGSLPVPNQTQQDDGAQAVLTATTPLPWTEAIEAHNHAVDEEYQAEIAARTALMRDGGYRPRFYVLDTELVIDPETGGVVSPTAQWLADPAHVNWHLEMTMDAGRRLDVTTTPGVVRQPVPTLAEVAERRAAERLMARLPSRETQPRLTARDLVGTRAQIVASCHDNEAMADLVEQRACELLGVRTLDEEVGA